MEFRHHAQREPLSPSKRFINRQDIDQSSQEEESYAAKAKKHFKSALDVYRENVAPIEKQEKALPRRSFSQVQVVQTRSIKPPVKLASLTSFFEPSQEEEDENQLKDKHLVRLTKKKALKRTFGSQEKREKSSNKRNISQVGVKGTVNKKLKITKGQQILTGYFRPSQGQKKREKPVSVNLEKREKSSNKRKISQVGVRERTVNKKLKITKGQQILTGYFRPSQGQEKRERSSTHYSGSSSSSSLRSSSDSLEHSPLNASSDMPTPGNSQVEPPVISNNQGYALNSEELREKIKEVLPIHPMFQAADVPSNFLVRQNVCQMHFEKAISMFDKLPLSADEKKRFAAEMAIQVAKLVSGNKSKRGVLNKLVDACISFLNRTDVKRELINVGVRWVNGKEYTQVKKMLSNFQNDFLATVILTYLEMAAAAAEVSLTKATHFYLVAKELDVCLANAESLSQNAVNSEKRFKPLVFPFMRPITEESIRPFINRFKAKYSRHLA